MRNYIALMTICYGFLACANRAVPSGGPRDETPPNIIWENSTPNRTLGFEKQPINLTFDEWVKLNDPLNQILISPPLEKRPEILLRGKTLTITFAPDETLRNDATYTINFGEAIQDITESNVVKNLTFVFSTGPYIDSLVIEGSVSDAFTHEPIQNATVMLYENLEDSVVFKDKPFYAAKTEQDGTFAIRNVKDGYFKMVALTDENLNYLFDPETDKIGFLPDALNTSDTTGQPVRLSLSLQTPGLVRNRLDSSGFNRISIPFNREPYEIGISFDSMGQEVFFHRQDMQILVWHRASSDLRWGLYLTDTISRLTDTLRLLSRPYSESIAVRPIQDLSVSSFTGHPLTPYTVCFDRPFRSIDTTLFLLRENDSLVDERIGIEADSFPSMCLDVTYKWVANSGYELVILPGALEDFFGLANDTIIRSFRVSDVEQFGNIYVNLEDLDIDQAYLIHLMERDQRVRSDWVEGKSMERISFQRLRPGNYTLVVIQDRNHNKRWDPADYMKRQEPEFLLRRELERLRANWDVEVSLKWTVSL